MKRSQIIVLLGLVCLFVVLALPALARADAAREGWTWDESAATAEPAPDGWTWDESAAPADPDPDGWTWDESSAGGEPSQ